MRLKKLRRSFCAAALALLTLFCGAGPIRADGMPSLFRNDEPWYKDSIAPMKLRGGEPYVPADFFGLFADISVTVPSDGNLLFVNGKTGDYVSILTQDASSAVNGTIGTTVGLFRDENIYYVEATPMCKALGLTMELTESAGGALSVRVTDGTERLSTAQLLSVYGPGSDDGEIRANADTAPPPAKIIHIWCTSPEDGTEYTIEAELERFGMACTVFLWDDADLTEILAGQSYGDYGVATPDADNTADALRAADDRIRSLTGRRTRWTLTTGDTEKDGELADAGFCILEPDFTVTSQTELDVMMMSFEAMLEERDEVSVFLTDSWKGIVAVSLIRALLDNHSDWSAANLGMHK